MTIPVLQRETDDWLPAPVTVDGVDVITGVSYAIVSGRARPTVFTAAVTRTGRIGFKVTALTPGHYNVYARIVAPPDTPVILLGSIQIV